MRRTGRWVIAVLLVSLLVACEDDPQPNFPTTSPSPTESSPSTSPTPEQETAEAFVTRWGVATAGMQNSGETSAYRALIDPDCEPCSDLMTLVSEYYRDGGYVKTQPWDVRSVRKRSGANPGEAEFEVEVLTSDTKYKTSSTAPVETLAGGRTRLAVTLTPTETSWLLLNYVVLAS